MYVIYPFLKMHFSKFYRASENGISRLKPIKSHKQRKSIRSAIGNNIARANNIIRAFSSLGLMSKQNDPN
jgi:hypothetical protein